MREGEGVTEKIKKVVLAYSGGLDTSVMLHWLRATYGCEVVCYCADVGQGEELAGLAEKAERPGAWRVSGGDRRQEFVGRELAVIVRRRGEGWQKAERARHFLAQRGEIEQARDADEAVEIQPVPALQKIAQTGAADGAVAFAAEKLR